MALVPPYKPKAIPDGCHLSSGGSPGSAWTAMPAFLHTTPLILAHASAFFLPFCHSGLAIVFFPRHKPTNYTEGTFRSPWFYGSCRLLTPQTSARDDEHGWYTLQAGKGHSLQRVYWNRMGKTFCPAEPVTYWPPTSARISLNTEGWGLARLYHRIKVTRIDTSRANLWNTSLLI